jgi:membrane protease YdiL (CAAX protease family)
VTEEVVYRGVLCSALRDHLSEWWVIAIGGAAFSVLHIIYGNAAPDNLIAGFFLAWAYIKSSTILIPILLHGLGNLAYFLFEVVYLLYPEYWCWLVVC